MPIQKNYSFKVAGAIVLLTLVFYGSYIQIITRVIPDDAPTPEYLTFSIKPSPVAMTSGASGSIYHL